MKKFGTFGIASLALASTAAALAVPAAAQYQYRQKISHSAAKCNGTHGPAVWITINGVSASQGTIRVQSYPGTRDDWLQNGRWPNRIELPAPAGQDLNGNGDTDLREDGGGMSNNPSINIFNLGKPSYKKTAFTVNGGVKQMTINMRYW